MIADRVIRYCLVAVPRHEEVKAFSTPLVCLSAVKSDGDLDGRYRYFVGGFFEGDCNYEDLMIFDEQSCREVALRTVREWNRLERMTEHLVEQAHGD